MACSQLSRAQQQWCSSSSSMRSACARGAPRATALLPQRPLRAALGARRCSGRSATVVVRAEGNRDGLARTVDTMLKRYDFVSTGMGALCVTGWFWSHGQPPLEALSIAACSTIVALVVNELVFTNNK